MRSHREAGNLQDLLDFAREASRKAKRITNATFTRTEYYDLVETRVINNNGEVIFKKSEEVKNSI